MPVGSAVARAFAGAAGERATAEGVAFVIFEVASDVETKDCLRHGWSVYGVELSFGR